MKSQNGFIRIEKDLLEINPEGLLLAHKDSNLDGQNQNL